MQFMKKRRKKSPRAKLKKYCDALWPKVTKKVWFEKYGHGCAWCKKQNVIYHSDHIESRSKFATRWCVDNCVVLCSVCHLYRKKSDPTGWYKMVESYLGADTMAALKLQSNRVEKVDMDQVKEYLELI